MWRPALIVVLAVTILLASLSLSRQDERASTLGLRPPPLSGRVIVIDPGHGGLDDGASHPEFPLMEKDLNLDIALRVARLLERAGATVVLTRQTDEMKGGNYLADLYIRARLANESGGTALVSIHANTFPDPSCSGGQSFFAPGCDQSKRLAELIQEEMARIQPGNDRLPQGHDYFILTATDMPAVLIEVGFLTSPADRRLLMDEAYRAQLAQALVRALARHRH